LLDEPLSNLDPDLRTVLRGELARIRRELGLTVLHVTHDREEAAELADRVVRMRAGRIETAAAEEKK
jgi:ABC-type sulfate/molybdate transport systems ATPase subunit